MTAEPTPTSRRAEVEANIRLFSKWLNDAGNIDAYIIRHDRLARTLASEIDDLRAEAETHVSEDTFNELQRQHDELWQVQNRTREERELYKLQLQDTIAMHDTVITKLLELLKPGSVERIGVFDSKLYARACEIAGRAE